MRHLLLAALAASTFAGCDVGQCDFWHQQNCHTGAGGDATAGDATPTQPEPTCASDTQSAPDGETWWNCTCRVHHRAPVSPPNPPGPTVGNGLVVDLKVPAVSAVDASLRVTSAFAQDQVLHYLYQLDSVLGCVPWVPGAPRRPRPHGGGSVETPENFSDGICELDQSAAGCAAPGADCAADADCCAGVCSEAGTCEPCRTDLEGCVSGAECCSGVCSLNACGG